jgi:RNA polymerase sigma-70 factor (ECF subfamily)
MSIRSDSGGAEHTGARHADDVMGERRQLINVSYRLLGSLAEAEDVAQEAFARWFAMTESERDAIKAPGAWLMTVASRICLNLLNSARARREIYTGEWIPEPLPNAAERIAGRSDGATIDPTDRVTLDESVNMAFLVMLESLTPAERVAFILHDVFRFSFSEVAETVGRTPAACRQLASSARRRLSAARTRPAQNWTPLNATLLERTVNGQPGLVAQQDGTTVTVFAFDIADDRITHIWVMRNPEKLRPWTFNREGRR